MQRPFVLLLAGLAAGILIGSMPVIPVSHIWCGAVCIFVVLIISVSINHKPLILACITMIFFTLGVLNIRQAAAPDISLDHIHHYACGDKLVTEGVICENPKSSPERIDLIVSSRTLIKDTRYIPVHGRILLTLQTDLPMRYGDYIRFRTRLSAPKSYHNPGGFDYEKQLRYKGILVRGTIYDATSLVIMRRGQGNPMRMMIESFRVYVKDLIMSNAPQPEGAIVQAMIFGDQKTIPSDVQDTFNRTGTSHIIAISGFNIGMIAFCVIFLIRSLLKASPTLLLRFNIMKISMVLAMIPVMAFAFIAGMRVSVVRAAIMTLLFMASILVG